MTGFCMWPKIQSGTFSPQPGSHFADLRGDSPSVYGAAVAQPYWDGAMVSLCIHGLKKHALYALTCQVSRGGATKLLACFTDASYLSVYTTAVDFPSCAGARLCVLPYPLETDAQPVATGVFQPGK